MSEQQDKPEILSLSVEELAEKVKELGQKPYRAKQLFHWLHGRRARSFDEMTDLPLAFRDELAARYSIPRLAVAEVHTDASGTSKYLFPRDSGRAGSDLHIESVLIRKPNRRTACLSTQVGCGQACTFCVTGQLKLRANLAPWEIEGQILAMEEHSGERIDHVVYMGMGEPLDNWKSVSRSLYLLRHQMGLGLAGRRITVSTAGVAPKIPVLGQEQPGVRLAVSIAAPDDYLRDVLMPINQRYPLDELMKACREFPLPARDKITFEYPLLRDVNDSPYHARRLAERLRGLRCKVNLIPMNESPLLPYQRPDPEIVQQFQQILVDHHIWTTVRYSAGNDVQAACGQLVYVNLEKDRPQDRKLALTPSVDEIASGN